MSFFKALASMVRQVFAHPPPRYNNINEPVAIEIFEFLSTKEIEAAKLEIQNFETNTRYIEHNILFGGLENDWQLVSRNIYEDENMSLDEMEAKTFTSFLDRQFEMDPLSVLESFNRQQ